MSAGGLVSAPAAGAHADGPGHIAARDARDAIEEALLSFAEIALAFDRHGVRDRLLRAIHVLYVVRGAPVIAVAHLEGLNEVAAITAECATLLAGAGEAGSLPTLQRAIALLTRASAVLRDAAEAVARVQLARRAELVGGGIDAGPPPPRPFRASQGTPSLHAFARRPMMPHVSVEPSGDLQVGAPSPAVHPPRVETVAELKAFAREAASGALAKRVNAPEPPRAASPPVAPRLAYEPAIEEVELVRRLGRDCLEDIANMRNLRKPNAGESWLDQEPFEARLLENIDAFAALGNAALPVISLYHAEADAPDPERAFAIALTLGCIDGSDTAGAAVMTLKQSAPEEHPGWMEGFRLAPSPAIDVAMADLCTSARPDLVALALDVLHARGRTSDEVLVSLLDRPEPAIATRVARALAAALPRQDAIDRLERICATTEDDEIFVAAVESLLRRGHGPAVDLLRRTIDAPTAGARGRRALPLLCLVGRASDLDRLLAAANEAPTVTLLRGLGRYGHVESLGALLNFLEHEDADVVAAAAEALDRITGAGLRETTEEPWDIELPPEAANAGGLPVPMRKVERVVTDPARWSAWVRDNARRLDAKLKTRGGRPFSALQIVDELEATATPPDRRDEAALELAVVTGIASTISPDDWVARQRHDLRALREQVSMAGSSPGAWSIRAQRHDAVSASPPRSVSRPDAPRPPENVVPPPPAFEVPSFAKAPALPPSATPPAPASLRPALMSTSVVSLPPELLAQLSQRALPFQQSGAQPASGSEVKETAPTPPHTTTTGEALSPAPVPSVIPDAGLPFAPARPAETAPAQPPSSARRAQPSGTMSFDAIPLSAVLPFARQNQPDQVRSTAPGPALPFTQASAVARLSLNQYAAFCAELEVFPGTASETYRRYGLASMQDGVALAAQWQEHFKSHPADYHTWERLRRFFLEHCRTKGRPDPRGNP